MRRTRGWTAPFPIGRYWRAALVVFFNYGVDTGTVWKPAPFHEPILWRHVSWGRQSPDREAKEQSPWGWLFYRRVKTGKTFSRTIGSVRCKLNESLLMVRLAFQDINPQDGPLQDASCPRTTSP